MINGNGYRALNPPRFGLGCSPYGGLYRQVSTDQALEAIAVALDSGVRYFDTAPYYGFGLSERRLGDALRETTSEYILSTKVGRRLERTDACTAGLRHGFYSSMPFDAVFDYSYDGVMRSYEASLHRLGLAKIDILYVHDIGGLTHGEDAEWRFRELMEGGYRALAELKGAGDVGAIGLGVNECEVCELALDHADFDVLMIAGRYTLIDRSAERMLFPRCLDRQVAIVLAGPFNSGILATGVNGGCTPQFNYAPASLDVVQLVRELERLCEDYNVSLAAAALQFPLRHQAVDTVVAGLGSAGRMKTTVDALNLSIPASFWADADSLVERTRAPSTQ